MLRKLREIAAAALAESIARETLTVSAAMEVPFDFAVQDDHAQYDRLVSACRRRWGANFRYEPHRARSAASFGFVTQKDAVEFALMCDRPLSASTARWAP